MGMYDRIYFFGADAERVACAHGHPQTGEFQTKDSPCELDDYYVFDGKLYVHKYSTNHPDAVAALHRPVEDSWALVGDVLTKKKTITAIPHRISGIWHAYRSCKTCDPVVYASGVESSYGGDRLRNEAPQIEYALQFTDGRLVEVLPKELETRDDVRARLTKQNSPIEVLPDDDRLVMRHLDLVRMDRKKPQR